MFLAGKPRLIPPGGGGGASASRHFRNLLHACTQYKTATKFCVVIKQNVRKIFTGRPRMPRRDLFAVVNLLVRWLLWHNSSGLCFVFIAVWFVWSLARL